MSPRVGLGALVLLLGCAAGSAAAPAAEQPRDPLLRTQWHLAAIQAPAAWAITRGRGVTVAVLDTGVAYEDRGPYRRAPDLRGARFVAGWDFVGGDAHPDDVPPADGSRSHGTQIATIIAASMGDRLGGVGVAPEATIMPLRVLRADRSGSARTIARGLRFAADHGADVANLSIAGRAPARVLRRAISYATVKGVTIVAAAGNDGRASVSWPAADPRVIAVGATDASRRLASYSNHGGALDVLAPGGAGERFDAGYGPPDGVLSQTVKGSPSDFCFCFMASTSAAAAQVAGVAALLIATGRATTPTEVRAAIVSSVRPLAGAPADADGAGLVQARAALDAIRPAGAVAPSQRRSPADSTSSTAWLAGAVAGAALVGLAAFAILRRRRRRGPASAGG